jgi:hypothetical protein
VLAAMLLVARVIDQQPKLQRGLSSGRERPLSGREGKTMSTQELLQGIFALLVGYLSKPSKEEAAQQAADWQKAVYGQ